MFATLSSLIKFLLFLAFFQSSDILYFGYILEIQNQSCFIVNVRTTFFRFFFLDLIHFRDLKTRNYIKECLPHLGRPIAALNVLSAQTPAKKIKIPLNLI